MANRFKKLVEEAKREITEISPVEAARRVGQREAILVDVRENDEWEEEHIPAAVNLSRGTIELEIEDKFPDPAAPIICHCGGGGRSALVAESLRRMGYNNVSSMAGGLKAWRAAGLPIQRREIRSELP